MSMKAPEGGSGYVAYAGDPAPAAETEPEPGWWGPAQQAEATAANHEAEAGG